MRKFSGNGRMDIAEARSSPSERSRIDDLVRLVPSDLELGLDVGARDGFLSRRLVEKVQHVYALDLVRPEVDHPRITAVKGDATQLVFPDGRFDLVMCAEVLEHIPSPALEAVCLELCRVSSRYVLIGVPFEQDTRVGRLTCHACGHRNPPWGHVSTFSRQRLVDLFGGLRMRDTSFVGAHKNRTNFVAAALNDFAGNPWGPYWQEERCIACGARFEGPPPRRSGSLQRIASKTAYVINAVQRIVSRPKPVWIHVLFEKS